MACGHKETVSTTCSVLSFVPLFYLVYDSFNIIISLCFNFLSDSMNLVSQCVLWFNLIITGTYNTCYNIVMIGLVLFLIKKKVDHLHYSTYLIYGNMYRYRLLILCECLVYLTLIDSTYVLYYMYMFSTFECLVPWPLMFDIFTVHFCK